MSGQLAASPTGDALVEKEAARLFSKLEGLKQIRAQVVAAGVPACKFTIDRRITDIGRNRKWLEALAGKDVHALLTAKLRVDRMLYFNI